MPDPRALLVSNDFAPQVGGIQQFTENLARRLPAAAVVAPAHPQAHAHDAALGLPVYRGRSPYLWPTPRTQAALRRAVSVSAARVVVFMAPFPLAVLGPGLGVPWAVCVHGAELVIPARTPVLRRAYRSWLRRADLLFTVSRYTGAHLRRLVGADGPAIRLLRNGVELDVFTPRVDGSGVRARHRLGHDPVVVCVGRLVPRKGQDALIRALPQVRRQLPDARLLLVGEGRIHRRLAAAARRLPPGAVAFAGRVPVGELPAHYAAGDVFAHPNRSRWLGLEQEGFGVTFLEAQATGLPVVAGDSGGAPEALIPGETGLIVDGADAQAVADAVADLLRDRDGARRMGQAGRRLVEEHFDWSRIAAGFACDLDALAAGHPPPPDM